MFSRKPANLPMEPQQAPPPLSTEPVPAPGRRFTDTLPTCATTIATGLTLRGVVSGTGSIRIEGELEGRVEIDGLCHIALGGKMVGPVSAGDAIVEGELEGRLLAKGRVELRASAKVRGNINASIVTAAEGCFFDGHMNTPGGDEPAHPVTFREKRRRRPAPPAEAQAKTVPPTPPPDDVPT